MQTSHSSLSRSTKVLLGTLLVLIGGAVAYTAVNYNDLFPNGSSVLQSQSNGWSSPVAGASKEIMTPEGCRKITSTQGAQFFIPTRSMNEWNSFKNGLPSGVTIAACGAPVNGVCGSANLNACVSTIDSTNGCTQGTFVSLTSSPPPNGHLTWTCQGLNGGSSVTCGSDTIPSGYDSYGSTSCSPVQCESFGTYTQFNSTTGVGTLKTYSSCRTDEITTQYFHWDSATLRWILDSQSTTGGQPRVCVQVC